MMTTLFCGLLLWGAYELGSYMGHREAVRMFERDK